MVKVGMVNGGGAEFIPAAKSVIFRDFTRHYAIPKSPLNINPAQN